MALADVVAWVMLAALIAWLGIVLWATYRTIDGESRAAAREREGR